MIEQNIVILTVARLIPPKSMGKNAKQKCERDCEREEQAAMPRAGSSVDGATLESPSLSQSRSQACFAFFLTVFEEKRDCSQSSQ